MGRKFVHWLLGDDPRKWLEPVKSSNPDEIPTFHIELVDKFGVKFHNGIPPGQLPEPDDKLYVVTKEPFHQIMVLDKKGGEHWFINNYNWTKRENKHEKEFVLSRMTASDMFKENEKAGELRRQDAIARGKGEEPKPRVRKNILVLGRQKFPRICVIDLDGMDMWADTASDDPDLLLVARKHRAVMKGVEEFMAKMTMDELGKYTKKWEKHMEKHGVAIVTKEDLDKVKVKAKATAKANTPVKTEGSQRESVEQRAVDALANAIVHSQPAGKVHVKSAAQPEHQRKEKETARAKTPVPGHQQMEKKKVAAKPQASPTPPPAPPKIPLDQPDGARNGRRIARIDPSVLSPEPRALRPQKGTMMVPMNQQVPTRAASPLPRSSTPYPAEDAFDDDHMANALSLNRSTPIPRSVSAGGPPQAPGYGSVYQPQSQYPAAQAAVFQSLYIPNVQQQVAQVAQAAVYQALYRQPTPQQQLPVGARHDRAVTPLPAPQPNRPFSSRAVSETQYLNPDRIPVSQPSIQHMTGNPNWKNDTNRATEGGRAKTPQPTTSLSIPSIKVSSPSSPRQKSPAPATRKPAPARSPSPAPPARDDRQTLPSQKAKASPSSSGQTQKTKPAQQPSAQATVQKPVQKQQQPAQKSVQQEKPALKVVTQQQPISQEKPAQKPAQVQQQKAVQQPAQQQKAVQPQQKTTAQAQQKAPAQAQRKTTAQVQQTPVQQQKKPVKTPVQQPAQQQNTATQVQQKPVEKKPVQQQPVKQSVQQPVQQQKTASPAQQRPVEKKPVQQQKAASPAQQKPVEKKPVQQKPVEKKPVQQQKAASQSQQKSVEKKPVQQPTTASQGQQQSSPATVVRKPAPAPAPSPAPTAASVKKTSGAGPRKPVPGAVPPPPPSIISSASSSPGPRLPRNPRPPGWDQIPTWNGPNGSRANSVAGGSEVGSVAGPPSMRQSSSASRTSMLSAAITAAVSAAVNAVAGATGGYGDDMNSSNPNDYQQNQQQGGQNQYHQGHGQGDPYQGGHMPGSWAFSPTVGNAEMAPGKFPNHQQQQIPAGVGHVCDAECCRSGCPAVVGDNAAFMFGTGYHPRYSRDPRAPR